MKRVLIGMAAIGALAAGLAIAQTAAAPQAGAAKVRGVRARMLKGLNLSATQKQLAKSIFQSAQQVAQPLAQQLKQDRVALTAAVEAGDSAKIQQLSTDMGSLHGNVLAARSQAMSKFYALLTPDQRTKAGEFRQKAQEVLGKGNGE